MQIILLSGGSGKRLWPLSNDLRSKQFLKLFKNHTGEYESMVQRIFNQILHSAIDAEITIATSEKQYDSIINQLGNSVNIVTEPERRDTFPAIALSSLYLIKEKKCNLDEVVVVMPSDSYVDDDYFEVIKEMTEVLQSSDIDIALMGITPSEPSTKFGYILPIKSENNQFMIVDKFAEKPNLTDANKLIQQGALWNGGVFAFKLSFIDTILNKYIQVDTFEEARNSYSTLAKTSFDYEVVEKTKSIGVIPYNGRWSDLGTWDTLSKKMSSTTIGNVTIGENCINSHVANELNTPVICLGIDNLIVAASPDGILVSTKEASVNLKQYADKINKRPMYEERRWGTYRVMGHEYFNDGYNALTKLLCINANCNISYQYHNLREEIWTVVDGCGIVMLDGEKIDISRGSVIHIKAKQKHAVKAITDLKIIEVQSGSNLIEEDIIRLNLNWI